MGVALYIQGYSKKAYCITGHIKALSCYEVDLDKIRNYELADTYLNLRSMLVSAELASYRFWDYGFESVSELSFHHNMSNFVRGTGYREENGVTYGLMFEPAFVLSAVVKLIDAFDDIPGINTPEIDKQELLDLKKVAEIISNSDGMIWLSCG